MSDLLDLPELKWSESPEIPAQFKVGDTWNFAIEGHSFGANDILEIPEGGSSLDELGLKLVVQPEGVRAFFLKPQEIGIPLLILKREGNAVARIASRNFKVESTLKQGEETPSGVMQPMPLGFPVVESILGILLVALVLGAVLFFLKKKLSKKAGVIPVIAPEESISCDERARRRLRILKESNDLDKGEFKAFAFELSEILKQYLGARYEFDALERTASEIHAKMVENAVNSEAIHSVRDIFNQLDFTKFSDFTPMREDAFVWWQMVFDLVERTKIVPIRTEGARAT